MWSSILYITGIILKSDDSYKSDKCELGIYFLYCFLKFAFHLKEAMELYVTLCGGRW